MKRARWVWWKLVRWPIDRRQIDIVEIVGDFQRVTRDEIQRAGIGPFAAGNLTLNLPWRLATAQALVTTTLGSPG
jgi:hypothetical protein